MIKQNTLKYRKLKEIEYFNNLLLANRSEPNTTQYWKDSDSQGQFKKRQRQAKKDTFIRTDTGTHKLVIDKHLKYWEYKSIKYTYNNFGFRSNDDFSNTEEGIVCLGCSFTEGIGLPIELNWGHLVAKKLGKKHYNLGQGALGLDSAFRLLLGYKDSLKFKDVFLLIPPPYRYEWIISDNELLKPYMEGKHQDFMQWLGQSFGGSTPIVEEHVKFFKSFLYGSEFNDTLHEIQTISAIKGICAEIGANLYVRSSKILDEERLNMGTNGIPSRDGHPDADQQEFYKEQFLKQYYENN